MLYKRKFFEYNKVTFIINDDLDTCVKDTHEMIRAAHFSAVRSAAFISELKEGLLNYTNNYFKERDCNILAINTDKDHLHIVFEAYPNLNLSHFINAFKSASSRRMRTDFAEYLKPFYWKPYFWSMSYFVGTVSEKSTQIVQDYIRNQDIR